IHRNHVFDQDIFLHALQLVLDRSGKTQWIATCPHQQGHVAPRTFCVWLVACEVRFSIESGVIDVADDADDRQPRFILWWSNFYPLANRVTVGPVTPRHLLIDDDDIGLATRVAIVKLATLK